MGGNVFNICIGLGLPWICYIFSSGIFQCNRVNSRTLPSMHACGDSHNSAVCMCGCIRGCVLPLTPFLNWRSRVCTLQLWTGSEYVDYDNYVFYGLAKGGILFPLLLLAILLVAFILLLVVTNWRLYMFVIGLPSLSLATIAVIATTAALCATLCICPCKYYQHFSLSHDHNYPWLFFLPICLLSCDRSFHLFFRATQPCSLPRLP